MIGTNKVQFLSNFQAEDDMNEPNSHENERDSETIHTWDCIIEKNLEILNVLLILYIQCIICFEHIIWENLESKNMLINKTKTAQPNEYSSL